MRFQRFLSALVWCLGMALAVVAVAMAAEKLTNRAIPGPNWLPFVIAGGVGLLIAAVIAVSTGPSRIDAAVAIDRAYQLRERLSTALTLPPELLETPAGQALLSDAARHLKGVDVRSEFGPRVPRLAWIPVVPAALAVGLLFVDGMATKRMQAKVSDRAEKKLVTEQSKALGKKIASQRKEIEKTKFPEADKLLAQIEKAAEELAKAPPAQKEKVLVELNKLTDALKERQKQLGSPEQLTRQLQQLKDMADNGPADQFAKDLAKGDFMKAGKEVAKLKDKLASGKMNESEKKALKDQLQQMAKQLEKLANLEERKKQIEEARKNGGLSQQQYEQEMAKLEEQAKTLQKLAQMASKLDAAQKQLEQGNLQKAAEALGATQEQLQQMAKNVQEIEALDGALAELQDAKNGMNGDGMNQLGEGLQGIGSMGKRMGNGQNGLGRGRGQGDRPEAPDSTSTYTSQVKQQVGKGKAVATGTAPSNSPVKGNSVIDVQAEMATNAGTAADALSNQKVPRNVERHVRGYFDQINKGR